MNDLESFSEVLDKVGKILSTTNKVAGQLNSLRQGKTALFIDFGYLDHEERVFLEDMILRRIDEARSKMSDVLYEALEQAE